MLTTCAEPGCETFVLGGRCLEHERPPARVFVRGRPFAPQPATTANGGLDTTLLTAAGSRAVRTRASADVPHGV